VKKGETVAEAAVRECREETGLEVKVTGLVGVFSNPGHVIEYIKGGKVKEVRQPINLCFRAQPVGGQITPSPDEALEVRWVDPGVLGTYDIHPAIALRIEHGLSGGPEPYLG
jgi:8-oxo-dGTP pyrophosphatase MutT (NUDIX family)